MLRLHPSAKEHRPTRRAAHASPRPPRSDFEDFEWTPPFQGEYAAIGKAYGFSGSLPVLEHGSLQLFQSFAIEQCAAPARTPAALGARAHSSPR